MDSRSERRLAEVHPDLRAVVYAAHRRRELEFIVTEGLRTLKRQEELFKVGASHTMNSRHLTGHAVDLAVLIGGRVRWDWPLYRRLYAIMRDAALHLGIPLEWGGNWRKFPDGPHYQLPWSRYP